MLARVKKNDTVVILSGKDKGKTGSVIDISPKKDKVMVKDVAVVTRHVKVQRQGETGGIKREETFIPLNKVMPICTSCKKPCRVSVALLENGSKARSCNKCNEKF